jgi:serine/threonine-protein kinase RsbW
VEIAKRLPFTAIDAYPAIVKPGAVAPAAVDPRATPVTLRLMTPDDAVAVAQCTYAVYGYTVPDDYLYFPDHMCEMLHGGLLEVCVGATAEGEIVSCLTREVERPGAAVGYLGEGMVDPRFRGHRLLEQMLAFFVQHATEERMLGLYAEAVTVHPFSQKSNLALGAAETGVQLADEAPVIFKQIADNTSEKRTATVLSYFKTNQGLRRTVYPPAHHQAMVERIYERSGLDRTVETATASTAAPPLSQGAQVRVDVFPRWSEAALRVTAYGSDLPDLVRLRLRELCLRRIDWISLDLPLSHPGVRDLCAPIEALGFFFAGVIPELADDDVLRLQYLNDVEADVESAQIASEFGQELFAYVVRAMRATAGGT